MMSCWQRSLPLFFLLNEKRRRLLLAAEARSLGHGGISRVARASGVSRATIHKALQEQEAAVTVTERVRRAGEGMVIARVPEADDFYAQGTTVEEARNELADVIEGNVLLALQLNLSVPKLPGVEILEQDIAQINVA